MTAATSHLVGTEIKITATVKIDGTLTTPTGHTIIIEGPAGTDSTPTKVNEGTGVEHFLFTPTETGWHNFELTGTSAAPYKRAGRFYVTTSAITAD